ncbi:MAG: hypothetical protein HXY34_05500 [Candidatus Thorarchaeota archaeon]|nr:hypothetical protein [Candidatus Thorarchaeota archaeon]
MRENEDGDHTIEERTDWDEYVHIPENRQESVSLELKDYVALFIAALQTVFLPLVILSVLLVAAALAFTFLW